MHRKEGTRMGGFGRLIAFMIALAIAIGLGAVVYNAGVTAGLAEAARLAAASGEIIPVPAYAFSPYWHGPGGFGFFGILFLIFGFFLVIGLARAAFGRGRWNGPLGPGGSGRWGGRHERMEELHRELHRREASSGEPAAST